MPLEDTETFRRAYELAGPRGYTLQELVELVAADHRRRL